MKTTPALTAVAALAMAVVLAPCVQAKTDAVYIGGTGTGFTLPVVGPIFGTGGGGGAYAKVFVPDLDELVNLKYDGSPVANPQAAVPAALAALGTTDDPAVVMGMSKGAQVAHGLEAKDTRTDTRYVVVGDPDSKHGISTVFGLSPKPVVHTHDWDEVVAEYDGVGDMPDRPNALAFVNALAGWAFVHPQYGNGTAGDPLTHLKDATVTSTKNPNGTTYTKHLIPTKTLPMVQPFRNTELTLTHRSVVTDKINAALKPMVDAGYSRNDTKKDTKDGNKVSPATKADTGADKNTTKTQVTTDKETDNDTGASTDTTD